MQISFRGHPVQLLTWPWPSRIHWTIPWNLRPQPDYIPSRLLLSPGNADLPWRAAPKQMWINQICWGRIPRRWGLTKSQNVKEFVLIVQQRLNLLPLVLYVLLKQFLLLLQDGNLLLTQQPFITTTGFIIISRRLTANALRRYDQQQQQQQPTTCHRHCDTRQL